MTTTRDEALDVEGRVQEIIRELLKRPMARRGPYVITDAMLSRSLKSNKGKDNE